MAPTSPGRDFDANPYSPDEERAAECLRRLLPDIGTGDDPIGFVLASWEQMAAERKSLRGAGRLTMAGDPSFVAALPEHLRVLREGAERAVPVSSSTMALKMTLGFLLGLAETTARNIAALTPGPVEPRVPRRAPASGDPEFGEPGARYPHP